MFLRFTRFHKKQDFSKKWNSAAKSCFHKFHGFYVKIWILRKWAQRRPRPLKIDGNLLVLRGVAHPGRTGAKNEKVMEVAKYFLAFQMKNRK